MLGSLDPAKVLVILVIALVVLGPERLPRAARKLGAAWRELTRIRDEVTQEVRSAIPDVDVPRIPPGTVAGFIRDLTRPTTTSLPTPAPGPGTRATAPAADGAGPGATARAHSPWNGTDAPGTTARSGAPALPVAPDDPGMN